MRAVSFGVELDVSNTILKFFYMVVLKIFEVENLLENLLEMEAISFQLFLRSSSLYPHSNFPNIKLVIFVSNMKFVEKRFL